jgi:hypothetical protein
LGYRKYVGWLKRIVSWLSEAMRVFLLLLAAVATSAIPLCFLSVRPALQLSGLLLQVGGMVIALKSLLRVRTHFNKPRLSESFSSWLKRFPWPTPPPAVVTVAAQGSSAQNSGSVETQGVQYDPRERLQDRVAVLARKIEVIEHEQDDQRNALEKLKSAVAQYKREAGEHAEEAAHAVRSHIESLHTDDFVVALAGLLYLALGIVFSGLASFI